MTRHRLFFATLVLVTIAGMLAMMVRALDVDGLDAVDVVMLVLFGITLPWLVVGFWNATIGFLIMSFSADPVGWSCRRRVASRQTPRSPLQPRFCCVSETSLRAEYYAILN